MLMLLLPVIYISFVSLGLPDALLGSAWPSIYPAFGVPVSYAGIISFIIAFCTIVSSLQSDRLTRKFGAGLVTAVSVAVTAVAIFGFSISSSFISLCLWALPYGLGAGSVDAALNNYVALHYKSKHMSWLHSMWGIGAASGPYIMGWVLAGGGTWNGGYRVISYLQAVITILLFLSLPLWKKDREDDKKDGNEKTLALGEVLSLPGAKPAFLSFFVYCALEQTTGLWASSYLTLYRGMSAESAASFASMFFIGITVGRILSGFLSIKLDDDRMVRVGLSVLAVGILILLLPLGQYGAVVSFVIIGLGCAPIYPSLIHSTPSHFGKENSQAVTGLEMASAYVGTSLMPPFFGVIAEHISVMLLPFYLLLLLVILTLMHTVTIKRTGRARHIDSCCHYERE